MNLKRILSVILAIILSFGACTVAFAEDQTTVPEGYIGIYTAEDLNNIRNNLSGKYILMNDIDLLVYENWEPIGTMDEPFTGELNGNGFYIKNLRIQKTLSDCENNFGLFGVAEDCLLNKIIVECGYISFFNQESNCASNQNVSAGMIVANLRSEDSGSIRNCSAVGKIDVSGGSSIAIGGLVGTTVNDNVIFSSSNYVDINISTQNYEQEIYAGGILGRPTSDKNSFSESYLFIKKAANFGNISINNELCSEENQIFAGGICANQISGNEFSECYNRGDISSTNNNGILVVGGIVGEAIWRIENCYNAGILNVTANGNDIINSICFVKMAGIYVGPPVSPEDFTVYNCYSLNTDFPLCSQNPNDYMVLYKNTHYLSDADMKEQSSFAGFDFENVWEMEENGYPVLKNQPTVCVKESIKLVEGTVYSDKVIANEWKTSNPNVATVNENGEIVAVGKGTATITVDHGYGYTENIAVVVNPQNSSQLNSFFNFITHHVITIIKFMRICISMIAKFLF